MSNIDDIAATIADIFEQQDWVWGLELAGIPEHVPNEHDIADKIAELLAKDAAIVRSPVHVPWLVSDARIVLAVGNPPPYDGYARVMLHIGEIKLP